MAAPMRNSLPLYFRHICKISLRPRCSAGTAAFRGFVLVRVRRNPAQAAVLRTLYSSSRWQASEKDESPSSSDSSDSSDEDKPSRPSEESKLNLAKPAGQMRQRLGTRPPKKSWKADLQKLKLAAKDLADAMGGDTEKIQSELNSKLEEHAEVTEKLKAAAKPEDITNPGTEAGHGKGTQKKKRKRKQKDMSEMPLRQETRQKTDAHPEKVTSKSERDILAHMRILSSASDSPRIRPAKGASPEENDRRERFARNMRREDRPEAGRTRLNNAEGSNWERLARNTRREDRPEAGRTRGNNRESFEKQTVRLNEAKPLGIFTKEYMEKAVSEKPFVSLFDVIREENLKKVLRPPTNAFEEMIQWTEEGKLWKFPVDNDQDWEEEQKVGFHEHVFLDQYLEGFPARGPIREFMELVIVGLSKNPYVTVEYKRDHIEWFREYFTGKQDVLLECLGKELSMPKQEQESLNA